MGLLLRHPSSLGHDTGSHPENAKRIRTIEAVLDGAGWPGVDLIESPEATREMLERVHHPTHVARIEELCVAGGGMIDADTIATDTSWAATVRAAGGAAEGAQRLLAGQTDFAFSLHRPPGHHAESDRSMGFCLFNSAAVAAAHAVAECGADRVLILDWDVHHGNGTAEIFDSSAEVLYASIHQSPLYPGTGSASEIGSGAGEGLTVNLPVPAGAGGREFLALVQHVIAPLARRFEPGLLIVSAGYDAHVADPLAGCEVTTPDYGQMAASMRDLGRELDAPVLVCLEGGYDPDALAESVLATILALGDGRAAESVDASPAGDARDRLGRIDRWAGVF